MSVKNKDGLVYPQCNINHLKSAYEYVSKKRWNPAERDEALKRATQLDDSLRKSSIQYSSVDGIALANKAENRQMMDALVTSRLGRINELNPTNRYRVQNFLENWMGIQFTKLGSGGELTSLGAVRNRLLEARRLGQNYVELLTHHTRNDAIASLQKQAYMLGKKYSIPKSEMNVLLRDAREIGGIAQQRAARNIHSSGHIILDMKYEEFTESLLERGFSGEDVDLLLDSANRIYARTDAVRAAAQALGVDAGNVEGIGYVPRMFQEPVMKFIKANKNQDEATAFMKKFKEDSNPLTLEYHFQKSRTTFNYIPEDEFLVAHLTGLEPEKLRQKIIDGTFQDHLHKNVDIKRIEEMLDIGLMSKIPMFSDEVASYVLSQFGDMPFKELDDLMLTDPTRVYSAYKDALQRAAGDSVMMKTMVEDGLGHGWTATKGMVAENSDAYAGWEWLPTHQIKKYYNAYEGGDLYIHPDVSSTFRAVDDLVQSPEKMSTLANIFRNIGGLWIQSALLSPGYVLRNLWTNVVSMHASGGNLLRIWEGFGDTAKFYNEGVEAFDDTQKVYRMGDKLVSKRRLFEEFFLHNGGSYVPQSSFLKAKEVNSFGNPLKSFGYLVNYAQAHGMIRPAKAGDKWLEGMTYMLEQMKQTQDIPMSYLARMTQFNEMSSKWATVVSRADTRLGNRVGQFIGATKGDALEDFAKEMRQVDNLFFMWDDIGRVPAFTGRYIMPFASVMMKIPPAIVRHAMTNPKKFVNYWRVRQLINQNAEEDPEYIDAGLADWKKDAGLLNLWKDPDSGNWVGIMTNSYDPISGGIGYFEKTIKNVAAASGVYSGSTESQTKFVREKYNWQMFSAEMLKDAPPINKLAVEYLTGIDLRTGEKKQKKLINDSPTFAGIRWYSPNPVVNASLGVVKGILASYPPTAAIDRTNINDVFGTPTIPDARNPFVPISPGTPSVFGNPRTEGSLERYYPEMQKVRALAVNALGFTPTVVDQAKQVQFNEQSMKSALLSIQKEIRTTSNRLYSGEVKDEAEQQNLYRQIKEAREIELKLDIANLRLNLWMKQRGILPKNVWSEMKSLGVSDLPPLAEDEAIDLQVKYVEQLSKDDSRFSELLNNK